MEQLFNSLAGIKPEFFAMGVALYLLITFEKALAALSSRIDKLTQAVIVMIDNLKDTTELVKNRENLQHLLDDYLKANTDIKGDSSNGK